MVTRNGDCRIVSSTWIHFLSFVKSVIVKRVRISGNAFEMGSLVACSDSVLLVPRVIGFILHKI